MNGKHFDLSRTVNGRGAIPFLDCVNFVRAVRVFPTLRPDWLMMAYPNTLALAYCDHPDKTRTIYYVRTDTWRADGINWGLVKHRHRQSVIVDAQTLGPIPYHRRSRRFSVEQRAYLANHVGQTRVRWQRLLAQHSDGSPASVNGPFWKPRRSVAQIVLESEQEIIWGSPANRGPQSRPFDLLYLREAWMYPGPGIINAIPVGHFAKRGWEIVGQARVNLRTQADAGLSQFAQRVWIADWSRELDSDPNFMFGGSVPRSRAGLVPQAEIQAGFTTRPLDPREIPPMSPDRLWQLSYRRGDWRRKQRDEHDPYPAE